MDLVLLALEPLEEPADALVVAAVAFHDVTTLFVGQLLPRHVEPDAQAFGVRFSLASSAR